MKFFHYFNYYLSCPKVFLYSSEKQKTKKKSKRNANSIPQTSSIHVKSITDIQFRNKSSNSISPLSPLDSGIIDVWLFYSRFQLYTSHNNLAYRHIHLPTERNQFRWSIERARKIVIVCVHAIHKE